MNRHNHKKKDIYIIKNDINNKVYIGQTVNPKQRWEQYCSLVKHKPNAQVITKAMKKYGIEHFTMSILETDVVNYDEREKYWIQKYNSIVPNGYNITIGGDGTGSGINNPIAKIKSEDVLMELIDEIIQNVLPFKALAKKYNISDGQISEINRGKAYYNPELSYPLRQSRYTEEKIKQLTYSLKYELDKSLKQISKEYEIDLSYLHDINQGRVWHRDYINYPIRLGKMKKAEIIHPQIKELLKNSTLSQKEIAKKFNVSQMTISEINQGKKGYDESIDYPIRKNYHKKGKETTLSPDIVDEICNIILNTNLSLKEISKKYEVSYATIQNINSGKVIKYRNEKKYKYPLRDNRK